LPKLRDAVETQISNNNAILAALDMSSTMKFTTFWGQGFRDGAAWFVIITSRTAREVASAAARENRLVVVTTQSFVVPHTTCVMP
jgi:hypothetical protein